MAIWRMACTGICTALVRIVRFPRRFVGVFESCMAHLDNPFAER